MSTSASRLRALMEKNTDRSYPIPSPYVFHDNYNEFVKKNELPVNAGTITTWSMYGAASMLSKGDDITMTFRFGDALVPCGAPWDDKWTTGEVTVGLFETASVLVENSFAKAGTYLLDLVGASQVAALDDKNIESYFKSTGIELSITSIKRSLPFLSTIIDNLLSDPLFIEKTKKFEWLRYHTTFASGNALVMKLLEATGTTLTYAGPFNIPPEVVKAVKDAVDSPWDKSASDKVPVTLKGIAHVYLEAIQMLPSAKWYQGERGRSNLTVAAVAAIKAYAIRVTELKANTDKIKAANSVKDADAALAATGAVPSVI